MEKPGKKKEGEIHSFLEKALKGRLIRKKKLSPEGSDRIYFRIYARTPPASYILAHSRLKQQKAFLRKLKDFSQRGLNVARVEARDRDKGFLLLEDLGRNSLEKEMGKRKTSSLSYYSRALDQIITLQKRKNRSAGWRVFTREDFLKEMLWTEKHLIEGFCGRKFHRTFQAGYLKEWRALCRELSLFPFAPAHRDYHSRNIFIKNKKLYLIDFQDAGFFPRFYDVVSLLYDVYVGSRLRAEDRKKLLAYFINESGFEDKKKGAGEKEAREIFLTALQRLFKACGSFASFYSLKGQKTHLPYISPALKMIKSLLKKQKNPYPFFGELIQKICP